MQLVKKAQKQLNGRALALVSLVFLAGCAGTNVQPTSRDGYVEIENPGLTMYPGASATIWVPRKSVDEGIPRGGELLKRGYQAATGGAEPTPAQAGTAATGGTTVTPPQAGITAPGGKQAALIQRFGLVVAVDGAKAYFNLGRDAGLTPGQQLKVYRGGTVIQGLGLAPGELVGTVEFQGFVGAGGFGIIKQGGQLRINDLVGTE
jgi:hypothetical protein